MESGGPVRVALVGNLANVAYQTTKFLRRLGVEADVFVRRSELGYPASDPASHDPEVARSRPPWLRIVEDSMPLARGRAMKAVARRAVDIDLLRRLRNYDLIESFCLAPWHVRWVGRPYISFATGADLGELALEESTSGRHARATFRGARLVLFGPERTHLEAIDRLGLSHVAPYHQLIDTDYFVPTMPAVKSAAELLVFHPANLDWTYTGRDRRTKGNDVLFRGVAQLLQRGGRAKLVYLERGLDVDATRALVRELGITNHVEALPGTLTRSELRSWYSRADIVADQFVNGPGLISLEAMSCGRPVLVALDARAVKACWDTPPPVLEAGTPGAVAEHLLSAAATATTVGARAREWVVANHAGESVARQLVSRFEAVLGRHI